MAALWWSLYALAGAAYVLVPVVVAHRDRRAAGAPAVREALARVGTDPATVGMLFGGPGRMVDAVIADLVARGEVSAADGRLALVAGPGGCGCGDGVEAAVRGSVGAVGARGVTAVRARLSADEAAFAPVFAPTFARLAQHGLVAGARDRVWWPELYGAGGMVLGALGMVGIAVGTALAGAFGWTAGLAIIGLLALVAVGMWLACRRTGYFGPDPRTALGLACSNQLRAGAGPDAPLAARVAAAGLDAAPEIRGDLAAEAALTGWRVPRRWTNAATGIDRVAIRLVVPEPSYG